MKLFGIDMIYTAVCTQMYIVHVESRGYFQRYIYRYSIGFPAVVFDAVSTTNFTPLSPSPQIPPPPPLFRCLLQKTKQETPFCI
jgi:hypothetical protein